MNFENLNEIVGLQFIPVNENKQPTVKGWQNTVKKYDLSNVWGVGLVCGEPSGMVEALDFDLKYDLTNTLFDRYKREVNSINPELLKKLVVQKTRSGGYHFIYKCTKISGNTKLARRHTTEQEKQETYESVYKAEILNKGCDEGVAKERARKSKEGDKNRVLIESRGMGGQIVISPSKGYEFIYGDICSISHITEDERDVLFSVAMSFNEFFEEVSAPKSQIPKVKSDGLSPFDDYNQRGDVVALLQSHGWKVVKNKGNKTLFLRPGQTTSQSSGNYDSNNNWFSVFTTSSIFEPEKAYLPYAVFAVLECNGDYSEAAKKLLDMGYGEKKQTVKEKAPSTRVIQSRVDVNDGDLSFLAKPSDYELYLQQVRTNTLPQGLTTGSALLDKHFLFKEGNFVMINGVDNVGKALSLDTPLPCPTGWVTMGEVKVGDSLFDENGNVCKVVYTTPVQLDKNCYEVSFSNGEKITCCEDHLWSITTEKKFKKVMSVKEMVSQGIKNVYKQKTLSKYSILLPNPIKMSHIDLPINPYTFGVWLGDGNSTCNHITSSEEDVDEMLQNIKNDKTPADKFFNGKDYQVRYRIKNFMTVLKDLSIYKNKHIPKIYLRSSIEQRTELLQGLMDTDGYVSKDGRLEFCTIKPSLAEGFCELISSLGIKYSVQKKTPSISGRKMNYKAYYISFSCAKNKLIPFKLTRKIKRLSSKRVRGTSVQIVSITPVSSVPVKCIQVDSDSHLFLCGKTMIPTHNTKMVWYLQLLAAMYHGWKGIIFASENTLGSCVRSMMQFYWGKPLYGDFAMNDMEYDIAKKFVEKHFLQIKAQEDLYNYKDILNMIRKTKQKYPDFNHCMIDPYNSLKIDLSGFSKLSTHEYHYEALSEMKAFGQQNNFGFFINHHAVTAAARAKDADKKYPLAPNKADTEGGSKVANKADDFLTIHRVTQHPTDWMVTEVHVRKIKETETGGRPTPIDEPVKFEMYKGGCAFMERKDNEMGYFKGIDPIQQWHLQNKPKQVEIKYEQPKNNSWIPLTDKEEF